VAAAAPLGGKDHRAAPAGAFAGVAVQGPGHHQLGEQRRHVLAALEPAGEVGVEALCRLGLLPHTTGQVYTVHLIRTSMRLVSYSDRNRVATALRPICTAATAAAA